MIAELNPDTTEILESKEGKEYIYQKVLFKGTGLVLGTRKLKTDNSTQACLDDYVKEHLSLKGGHTGDIMKEFLRNAIVCLYLSKGLIEQHSETGLYYMEPLTMVRMIELSFEHPYSSSLDWNVTAPNTLTVHGLLNVTLGAILGGFSIDNDKFESLAKTNGTANILLNGFDGSGHLAGGNIVWDAIGNLLISGRFESNRNGNKIIIDPTTRNIQLISPEKGILGSWSFFSTGSILQLFHKPSDVQIDETQMNGNTISFSMKNTNSGLSYNSRIGVNGIKFDINIFPTKNRLSELEVGELYRDGDVIKMKINN